MDVRDVKPRVGKILNNDYVSDVKYAVQHTRWTLTIIGIWPFVISNPTRLQKYVARITLPLCPCAIGLLVGCIICHAVFRAATPEDALLLFGPISYQTGNLAKNLIMISRRGAVKRLMESMEENWQRLETTYDRQIMHKYLKLGRDITTVCFFGMIGSNTAFFVAPYFADPYTNELNETVRVLLFPGPDMFVDMQTGRNYDIGYFTSLFLASFNVFVHTAIYNIAYVFVTHACGQIQIVVARINSLLESVDDAKSDVIVHERIAFIVRNHVRVFSALGSQIFVRLWAVFGFDLRFATKVEEFLRYICLVEILVTTLMICWVEYWCITNDDLLTALSFFLLLITYITNLFIFCHVGELLQDQIGATSYMTEWDRLPGKTGLALIMVIKMANYPRKLTAGRMMDLSYLSFGSILKASFAYLNMIRSASE